MMLYVRNSIFQVLWDYLKAPIAAFFREDFSVFTTVGSYLYAYTKKKKKNQFKPDLPCSYWLIVKVI